MLGRARGNRSNGDTTCKSRIYMTRHSNEGRACAAVDGVMGLLQELIRLSSNSIGALAALFVEKS